MACLVNRFLLKLLYQFVIFLALDYHPPAKNLAVLPSSLFSDPPVTGLVNKAFPCCRPGRDKIPIFPKQSLSDSCRLSSQ